MRTRTSDPPGHDALLRGLITGSVAVVIAGCAAQLVDYGLGLGLDALDSSQDGGIFGAVGDVAAASAAGAAWLLLVRRRPVLPAAVVLPPLLTFLALDKVVRLHDQVPHYLLLYAPVLAGAAVCLIGLIRRMPRESARTAAVGLGLLVFSFGLHVVGERLLLDLGLADSGWARQLKAVVKHGAEVQGWWLLAIGLARPVLGRRGSRAEV
ncbi:hypothetical protein [Petropleomorpha daqingensis]|uniref:YhhN-like protein n=1 Tax=Petropleomorpha daqingensis TaxID=2026353 RepID=A0A853CDB4_9ACTN|nr:hypothetical protein [Petropleomorpha daqingensis]NYJ05850.1 hypothetical protein [Petropleomorpha daqingensis]